ncbi:MAG TPA: hypothetical protein VGK02_00695 [Candidatus Aquicultor sp.]|jgi:hypothetical protein
MSKDKDSINLTNSDNGLTKANRAVYQKLRDCQVPEMIAVKPAYHLAQMYVQAQDFIVKSNDLTKLTETTKIAEKVVEIRESVKTLKHFSEQFGRSYYVLMDKLTALTDGWLSEEVERGEDLDAVDSVLDGLQSPDLSEGLKDELVSHTRKQYSAVVKQLIAKGCPEDAANYFAENVFELKIEAHNLIALVDHLISLDDDFEDLVFDVEETLVEISIPWVGFSPGETAHALWHIGNHDEDNFFFMGFLGWSLAILESLQENTEDL